MGECKYLENCDLVNAQTPDKPTATKLYQELSAELASGKCSRDKAADFAASDRGPSDLCPHMVYDLHWPYVKHQE